jgi:cell division transport system ATP-binding protein
MIRFVAASKRYQGGNEALTDVSFDVARGEMLFLTGPSGAGKSTLLKLIALLERPSRGQVLVDGKNLGTLPRRKVPEHRRSVGVIFQDNRLLNDRTVADNVMLPLAIAGMPAAEAAKRARAALDQVGLAGKDRMVPITLSGGEQQRVGIARAIVARPPLIIADEPTGNLDPELSLEIMRLFGRLNELGTTVVIASHDHDLIARMGKRVVSLKGGRLVAPTLVTTPSGAPRG